MPFSIIHFYRHHSHRHYFVSADIFSLTFILLSLFLVPSTCLLSDYNENPIGNGIGIVELRQRTKRGEHDLLDFGQGGDLGHPKIPSDYDVETENKEDAQTQGGSKITETTEHTYYNMTTVQSSGGDEAVFAGAYVDISSWISQGGAEGQTEHSHLDDAYRKAAGVRLKFEFPFYGHRLQNLTIATGGFLYVGDQTHSWLAATQYIAPLMANFDTMQNQSSIQYADDGKRMIVEWRDVTLRDNRQAGNFTFQVHLWRNGNITFIYKEVPIGVGNISDAHHPCKIGISDAYLFNHKVSTIPQSATPQSKRVIHEYHRITIPSEKIASKTVVFLKALPTCLEATTCEECIKKQLKQFKCSWCNPKENTKDQHGGGEMSQLSADNPKPFCSDQLGLHRRRQEWIEGHCQIQEENQYCKAEEAGSPEERNSSTVGPDIVPTQPSGGDIHPQSTSSTQQPTTIVDVNKAKTDTTAKKGLPDDQTEDGSGGIAFVTLFMLLAISAAIWVVYAYFNPHSRSGQLLIKYRPSKWQIPSSHVRYSASVHM